MTKTFTLSLAAGALLLAGTAIAQTPAATSTATPAPAAEMTRDAAQQRAAQMFTRLDANADGQLNTADRQALVETTATARFDRIDANSDGAISREEFAAVGAMRGIGRGEGRGGRMGRGGAMIGAADADSNGTVTQAEFNTAALARFDAADANDDGTVSRAERRAARPEGMGRGGRGDGRRGHRGMGR
jgi:Ca2+-binding EF-hand superfamily protein